MTDDHMGWVLHQILGHPLGDNPGTAVIVFGYTHRAPQQQALDKRGQRRMDARLELHADGKAGAYHRANNRQLNDICRRVGLLR